MLLVTKVGDKMVRGTGLDAGKPKVKKTNNLSNKGDLLAGASGGSGGSGRESEPSVDSPTLNASSPNTFTPILGGSSPNIFIQIPGNNLPIVFTPAELALSVDMSEEDRRLTPGEIEELKKKGYDIHDIKGKTGASKRDLFVDKKGRVVVKPKDGSGPGEDTGININDD
jgi:hypothetical protein